MFASKDPTQLNPNLKKAADNQILLGLLGELKSHVLNNDKSFESFTTISDEFFNILIHLLQFSSQIYNTIKKRQSYDKLLPKVKNSLSEEILLLKIVRQSKQKKRKIQKKLVNQLVVQILNRLNR